MLNSEGRVVLRYKIWSTEDEWRGKDIYVFEQTKDGKDSLPTGRPQIVVNNLLKQNKKKIIEKQVNGIKKTSTTAEKKWWEKMYKFFPNSKRRRTYLRSNYVEIPDVPTIRVQEHPFFFDRLPYQEPIRNYDEVTSQIATDALNKERLFKPLTTSRALSTRLTQESIIENGQSYPTDLFSSTSSISNNNEEPCALPHKEAGQSNIFFCKTIENVVRIGKILETSVDSIKLLIYRSQGKKWVPTNCEEDIDYLDIIPNSNRQFKLNNRGHIPEEHVTFFKTLLDM